MADKPVAQPANNGIPGAIISPVPGATSIDDQGTARNAKGQTLASNVQTPQGDANNGDQFDYGFSEANAPAATQHTQQTAAGKDTFDYGFSADNAPAATQQQQEPESTGVLGAVKRLASFPGQAYHAFADKMTDEEKTAYEAKLMKDYGPTDGPKAVEAFRNQGSFASALTRGVNRIVEQPSDELSARSEANAKKASDAYKSGNKLAAANYEAHAVENQLAADIPLVGPFVESAIDRGDKGDYTGAAADILLPEAAGELGAKVVKKVADKTGATQRVRAQNAEASVKTANAVHDARTEEVKVATDQIDANQQKLDEVKQKFANGQATQDDVHQAQTNLSGAVANADKAKTALADAEAARNKAAYEQTRVQREYDRSKGVQAPNKEQIKQQQATHGVAEDHNTAFPTPKRGPAAYTPEDAHIARGYVEEQHATKPITNTKDYFDAHQKAVDDIDDKIEQASAPYKNDPLTDPDGKSATMHVWDNVGKSPKAGFGEAALKAISEYNITDPSISEAQNIVTDINHENRAVLSKNRIGVAQALAIDPAFAGRYYLAQWLRKGMDTTLEDRGVNGVRQLRQDQASIIRVKNAIEPNIGSGDQIMGGSGTAGPLRQLAAVGSKGLLRTGLAMIPAVGPFIEAGAEHIGIPEKLGKTINPGDMTRDQLVQRMMKTQDAGRPVNDIYGTPKPSQTPGFETPPPPGSSLSPKEIREIQRENSPLHSALASHFGVFQGNVPYGELEERFMQDIADKQAHGQELTSSDQKILTKLNDENAAADAKARQQVIEQKMKEAAGQAEVLPSATIPRNFEAVQEMGKMQHGLTEHAAMEHDLAHHVVADEVLGDKLPQMGIRSGSHAENIHEGAMASAAYDWSNFKDDEGNLDPKKIAPHIDDFATVYLAGGVANAMWHGLPLESNLHLGADFRQLTGLMDDLGLTNKEQAQIIDTAGKRAKEILSRPGVEEVVRDHASVREPNLDADMHFSKKRIDQVLADVKGGKNASQGNESTGGAGESEKSDKQNADNAGRGNGAGQAEAKTKDAVAEAKPSEREGRKGSDGQAGKGKPVATEPNPRFSKPDLRVEHFGNTATLVDDEGTKGYLAYSKDGESAAVASSLLLDDELKGKGNGRELYEKTAEKLRGDGVKKFTSDADGATSPEAEKVWQSLEKRYPGEVTRNTGEGPKYTWNLDKAAEGPNPKFGKQENLSEETSRETVGQTFDGKPIKVTGHVLTNESGTPIAVIERNAEGWTAHKIQDTGTRKDYTWKTRNAVIDWAKEHFDSTKGPNPKFDVAEAAKKGLKEKTTGDPTRDEAIKQGGGIPASNFANLSMFHDPETGSTLALNHDDVTPERVRQHMAENRAAFAPGKAVEEQAKSGGFSFNPKDGSVPKDGYMVETHHDRAVDLGHVPTTDDIKKYIADNKDVLDQNPNLHIGGWRNTLGLSERVADEAAAVKAGQDRNQIAIYDVKNGKEIPTGGTGEVKPNAAQEGPNPKFDHGEVLDNMKRAYGVHDDPEVTRTAGFITPDAKFMDLPVDHTEAIEEHGGAPAGGAVDNRKDFINDTGAIRVHKSRERAGNVLAFSVPKDGVTEAQADAMARSFAKNGDRNGVLRIERADVSPETRNTLSKEQEFPSASQVKPMLRDINALKSEGPNPKFDNAQGPDRVSTRVPEGKNATENPMEGEPLGIGRDAIAASPQKMQDTFAKRAREISGVKIPKGITDNAKVYDRFVNHVAENLKWLYNQVPKEQQIANAKWYESANGLADKYGKDYGVSKQQAAGVIAALSPQMDWDINVSLAKRVMDTYKNHMEEPVTDAMMDKGREIIEKSRKNPKAAAANAALAEELPLLRGKKMSELTGMQRAMAVRLYDEANNPRGFNRIDPATGNEMEARTTAAGEPQAASWSNFKNIDKALKILDNDSRQTISDNIGKSHKVRNFYNNIIDPSNGHDVTIDTHAVGAGTLQPLSGNSPEVLQNFGQGGAKGTGVKGMYGLYADAYRKAAADLGLKARELQSVTWEKVRDMFPAEWKTKPNMERVKAEWKNYTDGKQTIDQTRNNILQMSTDAKAEVEAKQIADKAKAQAKAKKATDEPLAGQRIAGLDFLNAMRENRGQGNLFGGK